MKNEVHKFATAYKTNKYFFNNIIEIKFSIFGLNYLTPLISFRNEIDKIFKREPI